MLFENFALGASTLLLRFAEMLPYTRNRSLGLSCKPLYPPGAEEQYRREDPAPSHVPERAVPYVRRELISLLSFVRWQIRPGGSGCLAGPRGGWVYLGRCVWDAFHAMYVQAEDCPQQSVRRKYKSKLNLWNFFKNLWNVLTNIGLVSKLILSFQVFDSKINLSHQWHEFTDWISLVKSASYLVRSVSSVW